MSGWPESTLGDVCEVIAGQSPKSSAYNDAGQGLPFYQGKKDFTDRYLASPSTWTTAVTKRALPDDILMSVRAPVGPINVTRQEVCIGRGLAAIRASSKVDDGFLWYALLWLQPKIVGNAGAVFPSINKKQIEALPIPLPPLKEQKRIVAVLDQAFAALDRARALAEANLADAEELFPSILGEAFKPEAPWQILSISDLIAQEVIERPIDGNHGETHPKKADFVDGGVPFIMASDLHGGLVDQENCYFITREQADALRKGFAKQGDVLLSHKGTIGRAAILTTLLDYVMLTPQVTYYRVVDHARLDHEFLFYCFQSADFQKQMNEIAGIGATRAYIGITRQHELRLPLPKIEDQKELVAKFKTAQHKSRSLNGEYEAALSDLDDLRQSLLQKAFAGELT